MLIWYVLLPGYRQTCLLKSTFGWLDVSLGCAAGTGFCYLMSTCSNTRILCWFVLGVRTRHLMCQLFLFKNCAAGLWRAVIRLVYCGCWEKDRAMSFLSHVKYERSSCHGAFSSHSSVTDSGTPVLGHLDGKGEVEGRKAGDHSVPESSKHTPLTGANLQCSITYWHEFVNTKPNFRTDMAAIYSEFFNFKHQNILFFPN